VSQRLLAEWGNRVRAEYTSAALAAQVVHGCIRCGLPEELVDTGLRIVRDELDHARLSHGCRVALGGDDAPLALEPDALASPATAAGPLLDLADSVVRNFCLGETFAVPLFQAMRRGTTHPAARAVLDRVLQDEVVHRGFGWDTLDALLERDPEAVRARVQARLPASLRDFHRGYGQAVAGPPLTEAERAGGMIDAPEYRAIHDRTLAEQIGPWLARRGIHLPAPV
jgi:hypothetical protein